MPRKIELDSLRAELGTLNELLEAAKSNSDVVGALQYSQRIENITEKIKELGKNINPKANIALFFGGKPVIGSRGISASFTGKLLEEFQDIISKIFASYEYGDLGKRGKIPLKESTQLMITEIAKGSFGFVLEELTDQFELTDSSLKTIVQQASDIIYKSSQEDDVVFENLVENLDGRTLLSLRNFFIHLDSSEATIRIVEDLNEYSLNSKEILRARQRTESTQINEEPFEIIGLLVGFLPEHRKFELKIEEDEIIYGTISKDANNELIKLVKKGISVINSKVKVSGISRTVAPLNRKPRKLYTLLEIIEIFEDET